VTGIVMLDTSPVIRRQQREEREQRGEGAQPVDSAAEVQGV
jgi:hypothetical protein